MRPFVVTADASAGGNTFTPVYVVDHWSTPCNIAVGVRVNGSAVYTVQHTFDDPYTVNLNVPTNGTWYNNADLAADTTNGDSNYAFPPTAIRMFIASAASAQAIMTIIQAGPR